MMKTLKPFAKTFFSEWFLSPDRDADLQVENRASVSMSKVGELISWDEKSSDKTRDLLAGEDVEWTTKSGTSNGYHGGLCVLVRQFVSPEVRHADLL